MMLNQRDTVNVSAWNFRVRLERPGCDIGGGLSCDFLRLPDPYSSLWVLSRARVQHFMKHRFWRCDASGRAQPALVPLRRSHCTNG